MLRGWGEFEMGSVVTLKWARELPKEEAPLFLVVGSHDSSVHRRYQTLKIYCYFSNHKDKSTKGWIHKVFSMPGRKLIKVNI